MLFFSLFISKVLEITVTDGETSITGQAARSITRTTQYQSDVMKQAPYHLPAGDYEPVGCAPLSKFSFFLTS
jgi:hypothetical protein